MGRKKLLLEPIPRETTKWKEALKKRKASLFKKASELSTLCGVETCVVLFDGPHDPTPQTWAPRPDGAMAIVSRFLSVPEAERAKKMLHLQSFLPGPHQQQVHAQLPVPDAVQLQLQAMRLELHNIDRENRQLEAADFLNDVLSGQSTIADVASKKTDISMADLSALVQKRTSEVNRRISELASHVPVSAPPPAGPLMTPEMGTTSTSAAISLEERYGPTEDVDDSFSLDDLHHRCRADEGTPMEFWDVVDNISDYF